MLCPTCRFDNFEGEDTCANCGADLAGRGRARSPRLEFHDTVLGEHLDALGIGRPPDRDAGRRRSPTRSARCTTRASDCLLVCDGGRLVGIFTDRDAVVKVAGKRLDRTTCGTS